MTVPAGWYPDPLGEAAQRWWDGSVWTEHVNPPVAATPPAATPQPRRPPPSRRAAGPGSAVPTRPSWDLAEPVAETPSDEPDLASLDANGLRAELERLAAQVVETRELVLLQEVGLYEYSHPLEDSAKFKGALRDLVAKQKALVKAGKAVQGTDKWAINGSQKEGAKMVTDFCKLLLRAYNAEADNLVRGVKPYGKDSAIERLEKMKASISKLATMMKIGVTDDYHQLRVREIELTSDYKAMLEEEKERAREERERLKEEAAARKEFERAQAKLEKEKAHYLAAMDALKNNDDPEAVAQAEEKLKEIEDALQGVIDRAANIRAGYVYVISNIGSFGDRMVKIGMTRRLEPMDRVNELGSASVPFRFDVHCLFFSADAVGIENALHKRFEDRRVNHVNLRREHFFVKPSEVLEALQELQGDVITFTEEPEALEWHQSQNILKAKGIDPC